MPRNTDLGYPKESKGNHTRRHIGGDVGDMVTAKWGAFGTGGDASYAVMLLALGWVEAIIYYYYIFQGKLVF